MEDDTVYQNGKILTYRGKPVVPLDQMIPITSEQYAQFVLSMQKLQAVKAIVDAWTSFNAEADVILAVQKIVE